MQLTSFTLVESCATIHDMMTTDLKQLLKDRKLRLIDLSREAKVDKATVTRWAQNRVPAERVLEVEGITGISRHVLRPDIYGPSPKRPRSMRASA